MSLFGWSYPAGCSGPPDDDYPEDCPVCQKPNVDEDGDWLMSGEAEGFCSTSCMEEYVEIARAFADAEAKAMADMELEWAEIEAAARDLPPEDC